MPFALHSAPWIEMWAIAGFEFCVVKLASLTHRPAHCSPLRLAAYLLIWPGMNAGTFLNPRRVADGSSTSEFVYAVLKMVFGAALCWWAASRAAATPDVAAGCIGMLGLIFTLHFGVFHLISCCWRQRGVIAPPIMRAPIAATSLSEFWSERWNIAFAESARRFVLRPLVRKVGVARASAFVFFLSGLIHESVISLPARGGWGGPTLYFLIQGGGVFLERSVVGLKLALGSGGARGWIWTLLITAAPLPLLFHAPFVARVITPFFQSLGAHLP